MRSGHGSHVLTGALVVAVVCAAAACHPSAAPRAARQVAAPAGGPRVSAPRVEAVARAGPPAPGPVAARRRVLASTTSLVILEPIRFLGASPAIDPRSSAMLDAVAGSFVDHADLELIEVRADGADAPAAVRPQLGLARALQVVEALVARGVARARLRPVAAALPPAAGPAFVIVRRRSGG